METLGTISVMDLRAAALEGDEEALYELRALEDDDGFNGGCGHNTVPALESEDGE